MSAVLQFAENAGSNKIVNTKFCNLNKCRRAGFGFSATVAISRILCAFDIQIYHSTARKRVEFTMFMHYLHLDYVYGCIQLLLNIHSIFSIP